MEAEFPYELAFHWRTYLALKASTDGNSITYSDMGWYSNIHGFRLLPWEAELIQSLDRVYRDVRDREDNG